MTLNRRALFLGAGAALAAPTIVRAQTIIQVNLDGYFQHGQCRFGLDNPPSPMSSPYSTNTLKLKPYNGNKIIVGNVLRTIPAAGVSYSATGLSASTVYYAYLAWNGSALVGEFSTTGHVTDADSGVEVKSGDNSRTLVGMARTWTDSLFRDWQNYCCIRSWFNDPGIRGEESLQADRSLSVNSNFAEIHSEIRIYCLLWKDEYPTVGVGGMATMNTTGSIWNSLVWDGNLSLPSPVAAFNLAATVNSAGWLVPVTGSQTFNSRSDPIPEGYHFFTLTGRCNIGTATWLAHQQAGTPTSLWLSSRK